MTIDELPSGGVPRSVVEPRLQVRYSVNPRTCGASCLILPCSDQQPALRKSRLSGTPLRLAMHSMMGWSRLSFHSWHAAMFSDNRDEPARRIRTASAWGRICGNAENSSLLHSDGSAMAVWKALLTRMI